MTNVRQTSIDAYRKLNIGNQERHILLTMAEQWQFPDWTLKELSRATGLEINAISGRVNSLKNKPPRYLIERPTRRCSITQRTVTPVSLRVM